MPGSADGRDLAPRVAALLHRPLYAGAISVAAHRVELARKGSTEIHETNPGPEFVATFQPGVRGVASDPTFGTPTVTDATPVHQPATPHRDAAVTAVLPPDPTSIDLAEAPRIVGGGAGLDDASRMAQLADIGARIGASMGATRVITDRGWVPHQRQIGTTGVVVAPDLYLAFGVSGAVQHTSGLGDPTHIISVNTDGHCPMMQLADLAIVTDANATLDHLSALLQELR
jgi:electron transfer flavoprotein alpha subunit